MKAESVKQVAILLPWLKMGGTNKIAINFINELKKYCKVTLILSHDTGELRNLLPDDIRLVIDEMPEFRDILKTDLRNFNVRFLAADFIYYIKIKTGNDSVDNYKYMVERVRPVSSQEFDCAISFHGQSPELLLKLLYRIRARKKMVWIHGEFSFSKDKLRRLEKYYSKIDYFFFVSQATRESFNKVFAIAPKESVVYHNPIDKGEILQKAQYPLSFSFDKKYLYILTVGRLSKEKGQDMIPKVMQRLLGEGYPIKWILIGEGDSRKQLEKMCREYQVENEVIFLGTQSNPYNFMRRCDIYVQPSYTEGYSTTICEAGILGKAIIGTVPSGGIREQIADHEDGLIVDANVESILDGVKYLVENPEIRDLYGKRIKERDFEGKNEIHKFLNIL